MEIIIKMTPTFNRWVKTEEQFINMFQDTLENEMGKGDVDGEIHSVEIHKEHEHCPQCNCPID